MATSFLVVKNRAESTLASGINDSDLSLTVATGEGSKFPSTYSFNITIDDEILTCTSRTGDVLTVTRGSESTTPATHLADAAVEIRLTAKSISDLATAVNAIENEAAYSRLSGWTTDKLLKGAGTDVNPTEIDIPSGLTFTQLEGSDYHSCTTSDWEDWDLSSIIPAGTATVMLHHWKSGGLASGYVGARENGSSDVRDPFYSRNYYAMSSIITNVDSNRVVEVKGYTGGPTSTFRIMGYWS